MASESDRTDELLELLGAAWDGRMDQPAVGRLEELLSSDPQAHETLVEFSNLQVELMWVAASTAAHHKALDHVEPSLFAQRDGQPALSRKLTSPPRNQRTTATSWRFGARGWRYGIAAAVALVTALVGIGWLMRPAAPSNPNVVQRIHLVRAPYKVARLVAAAEARWQGGVVRPLGELFAQQDRVTLESGTAQISMSYGADVLLQGPCSIEFISASRIRLEQGTLTAQASPWAKGFVVDAEGLRVTDLGTRFAVVAGNGEAEAHVFQGKVEVESVAALAGTSNRMLTLRTGEAVRWLRADQSLQPLSADSTRFATSLPSFRPQRLIDMGDTGRGLREGSRDPRWRIVAGHSSGGAFPTQAVVASADPYYLEEETSPNLPGNARGNSQWISTPGGVSRGVAPHTAFTFETTFDLTGIDPSTVHLVGQLLADNRVQNIRLNGKTLPFEPFEIFRIEDFQRFHVLEIDSGFVAGVNRIEFDVLNGAVDSNLNNPMALRVEWQGFGQAAN